MQLRLSSSVVVFIFATLLFGIFSPSSVEARIFDYKDSSLAGYLRGTGGLSQVGDAAFAKSSGSDTVIDGEPKYTYSGEIGAALGLGSILNLRLGVEMIGHQKVEETKGRSPADVERFTLESSIYVFNPNATIEYIFGNVSSTRFYFAFGVGLADVTVENKYTMSDEGAAEYGLTSYTEKLAGSGISSHVGLGVETLFVDNVTFFGDFGYRYLEIGTLTYKGDVNSILVPSGASKGDEALDFNGAKRTIDLSGITAGIGFRFYFNFL